MFQIIGRGRCCHFGPRLLGIGSGHSIGGRSLRVQSSMHEWLFSTRADLLFLAAWRVEYYIFRLGHLKPIRASFLLIFFLNYLIFFKRRRARRRSQISISCFLWSDLRREEVIFRGWDLFELNGGSDWVRRSLFWHALHAAAMLCFRIEISNYERLPSSQTACLRGWVDRAPSTFNLLHLRDLMDSHYRLLWGLRLWVINNAARFLLTEGPIHSFRERSLRHER